MAMKCSSKIAALFICLILVGGQFVSATQVDTSECSCNKRKPKPKPTPPPSTPSPSTPSPPTPSPSGSGGRCPRDALKLSVCADLLGLVNVIVGSPATKPCCSLLQGLVDLDAAICLCTAIKANILGLNLNIPVSLSLLLNACGRVNPSRFKCA